LKGHDFSHADKAHKMTRALQAAEKLQLEVDVRKGTTSVVP